jgi:Transposase IS4
MMFPPKQLTSIVTYTNRELEDLKKRRTTKSEILKFFGFVVLCTKYEFSSRASLWSETAPTKYEKAAAFGRFGMARMRFDDLWRCI